LPPRAAPLRIGMSFLPASRFGRVLFILFVLLCAALAWWRLDSTRLLLAKQKELVGWAEQGSPADFPEDFAAPDYTDQWGHTPQEVAQNVRAVRYAYQKLKVTAESPQLERAGDTAVITQHITVTGTGERREHEFQFTWQKQSLWPWSWRLREVRAPGLDF
jgi:hypothetical protein